MGNDLKYKVTVDADGAPLSRFKSQFQGLIGSLKAGLSIDIGRRLLDGLGSIKNAFVNSVREGVRYNSTIQDLSVSFSTLLGGMDKARARMAEIAKFAAATPFELPEVAKASKILETLTRGALSTGAGLRLVGDVAASTGQPFEMLAVQIGRMYDGLQSGRPVGEAMMRLQELGVISGDVRAKIEALAAAGDGGKAWQVAEQAFGRFAGEMDKRSKTLSGVISTLRDNMRAAFGVAAQGLFASLGGTFERMSARLQSPEFLATMRTTGGQIAIVAKRVLALGEFAVKHTGALLGLATATAVFGTALTGLKLAQTVTGMTAWLGSLGAGRAASAASAAAIGTETAALAANTTARQANAAARGGAAAAGAAQTGGSIAAGFGAAIGKLAVWGTIAAIVGQGIADRIRAGADAKMAAAYDRANADAAVFGDLRRRTTDVASAEEQRAVYADVAAALNEQLTRSVADRDQTAIAGYERMLSRLAGLTDADFSAAAARRASTQAEEKKRQGDEWASENARTRQDYFKRQFERDEQASFAGAMSGADPDRQAKLIAARIAELEKRGQAYANADIRGMDPKAYADMTTKAAATADELTELKQRLADLRREIAKAAADEKDRTETESREKTERATAEKQAQAQTAADAKEAYRRSLQTDAERVAELEKRNAVISKQGPAASLGDQADYWNNKIEIDRLNKQIQANMAASAPVSPEDAAPGQSAPRLYGRAAWRAAWNAQQARRRDGGMGIWGAGERWGERPDNVGSPAARMNELGGWRHSPVRESPLRNRGRDPAEATAENTRSMRDDLAEIRKNLKPI